MKTLIKDNLLDELDKIKKVVEKEGLYKKNESDKTAVKIGDMEDGVYLLDTEEKVEGMVGENDEVDGGLKNGKIIFLYSRWFKFIDEEVKEKIDKAVLEMYKKNRKELVLVIENSDCDELLVNKKGEKFLKEWF